MSGLGGDGASDANAPGDTLEDIHRRNRAAGADIFSPAQGFNPDRKGLSGKVAADIALNPFSDYSTESEKTYAAAQAILPGGLLIGGLRTLGMMGKVGGTPVPTDNQGGDNDPAPVPLPLKKPRSLVGTAGTATSIGQAKATAAQIRGETRLSADTIKFAQGRDRRRQGRSLISGTMLGIQDEELQRTLG
jgi:hypothetical protein